MKQICPNLKNKEVAKEFGELQDLFGEETAHLLWSRNNGYSIDKAPNGAESVLFGDLLELAEGDRNKALILKAKVYSNEFFSWFGDWTSEDKTNVSKVVDENGEPKAVYHTVAGRYDPSFKKFDTHIEGRETAIYHTDSLYMSSSYNGKSFISYEKYIIPYNDGKTSLQNKIRSLLNTAKEYASSEEDKYWINDALSKIKSGEFDSSSYDDRMYQSPYDYVLSNLIGLANRAQNQDEWLWSFRQKIKDAKLSLLNNPAINKTENDLKETLKNVKIDYLCIKNPKVFDAEGRDWRSVIQSDKSTSEQYQHFLGAIDSVDISEVMGNPALKGYPRDEVINQVREFAGTLKVCIKRDEVIAADATPTAVWVLQEITGIKIPTYDPITGDLFNGKGKSTRDIEEMYLRQGGSKTANGVDGVIINNVKDYGMYTPDNTPHTVYEAIDNSQVKSIYNNGEFANPDDMYASQDDRANHIMTLRIAGPYLAKPNEPYLKKQYTSKKFRSELVARLREYDPQMFIKPNQDGRWYIGRSREKVELFKKQLNLTGGITHDEVHAYLREAFKDSPLLTLINHILSQANSGETTIKFKIGLLPPGIAAQFNPKDGTITIATGAKAKFRNNSNLKDYVAQTILHELVHYYTYNALHNSSKLRQEAENLRRYVINKLGKNVNEYGLTNIYEMLAELTNVDFVNKLKSIDMPQRTLDNILQKVKRFIRMAFGNIFKDKEKGTAYQQAIELLIKASNPEQTGVEFDIKDDVVDPMNSITASVDKVDSIHSQITKLYQDMYKSYKKQLNKGANRQRREDSLWATIKDLQAKEKKEASSLAIHQALQQLGVYQLDPTMGVIPSRVDTILGFLQQKSTANFDNISADQIFDMKTNIIDFYNDLVKYLDDAKDDLDAQDKLDMDKLNATIREVNRLWRQAAIVVGDKIVDDCVDKYLSDTPEHKTEIKEVAKDWLHKNDMWGDEGRFTMFFNYSRNDSPIIKMAFQMIQDADQETRKQSLAVQKRIMKAFNKATNLGDKAFKGNWQTELMERDKDGNFTGLFRSAVNRGQFKKDLEQFKSELCDEWEDVYGYHYTTDPITGETLRSDTGESVENEMWIKDVPPAYIEFQRRIEEWLCDHAHRRYSKAYYMARLSQPYDKSTGKGHGLSPNTLSRQKYIQDQLNYILQKCTDKKTGLVYPERLNLQDSQKLEMWRDALQDLGNPFDREGNRKSDEELQIALELQAWNGWLSEQTSYNINFDAYDAEYQNIVNAINRREKTYTDLNRFIEANSEWSINPEFLEWIFGNNHVHKDYVVRLFQSSMKKLVKTKNGYVKDFSDIIFKTNPDGTVSVPDVWGYSRLADIKNNAYANQTGVDPQLFKAAIDMRLVDYTDPSGMCLAVDGVTKFDPQNNPSGLKAMSWFDYILNKYTEAAMDGRMPRFVSVDGSVGVDFSTFGGNKAAIKKWISDNILTYTKTWTGKGGKMMSAVTPLTIFSQMVPKSATFGTEHKPTSRFVPRGRFSTKRSDTIFDPEFVEEEGSGMQPDFGKYGDQEFVDMISKGGAKAEYYKLLVDTMAQQWEKLGLDPSYNRYKLPQIEGSSAMKRARMFKHPIGTLKNVGENIINFTSDDEGTRANGDYVQRNGKWVLKTAPTRYINELEDPNMISSDLAYTVGQFVQMANNYRNKQKIQGQLETLGFNLETENRDIEHQTTGKRQQERYQQELKQLFYEQSQTNESVGEKPGKAQVAAAKVNKLARSGTGYLLLAYNLPSMFVGVGDAMIQLPAHAARGDQFGFKDLGLSMIKTFPNLFKALMNIGNPIANCKAVAMMQKDGLVKTSSESFKNTYHTRLRKALAESATGGYTMGDYMVNMLAQRAAYSAKKYYPGNTIVEEGFYTKDEFDRLMSDSGLTQKSINKDWYKYHGESLWSAYIFDHGVVKLKPTYDGVKIYDSKLSATIQQTASLINGNAPKNDQSAVSNNILHKFFFLMRNFFIRRMEHWFAGTKPDNIARHFEEETEVTHRGSTTTDTKRTKKAPLTQEQKSRRQAMDYSTGEGQPAVMTNLLRGAVSQLAIFNQIVRHNSDRLTDPRHINPNEAKALREFVTFGLTLALLSVGWMMFHRWVQDETNELKPETYEESIPSLDNFTKQKVYFKMIDQEWFRVIDSQIQTYNPFAFVDMIKSATTVTSFIEKVSTPMSVGLDLIGASGHEFDEEITSDSKYKYFPRWQRALWTATPLNNIQTWSSWRGNDKVGRWYFDNTVTGTLFKSGGYEWKGDDEEEGEEITTPKYHIPKVHIPKVHVPKVHF